MVTLKPQDTDILKPALNIKKLDLKLGLRIHLHKIGTMIN